MLSFGADENFNIHIVNGVLRRLPTADIVRVQSAGLDGADDPAVLEWAANEGRVLLTHDVNTLTAFGYELTALACECWACLKSLCRFRSTLQIIV